MLKNVSKLFQQADLRRTMLLYLSFLAFGGSVFFFNSFSARILGPDIFGTLSLAISVVSSLGYLLDFGASFAGANILNHYHSKGDEAGTRSFLGLFFVIQILFAAIALIGLFAVALILRNGHPSLSEILIVTLPFGCFYSSQIYLTNLLKAGRLLSQLIVFFLAESAFLLVFPLLLPADGRSATALGRIFFASVPFGLALVVVLTRPRFRQFSQPWRELKERIKSYGLRVYGSSMLAQLTFYLDSILIGAFHDSREVGIYNLGMMMINVIFLFSHSYSQANFHPFSRSNEIPPQVLRLNFFWLVFSIAIGFLIKGPLIAYFFGPQYSDVSNVLNFLLPAVLFKGLYQPYILFLHAHSVERISRVETELSVLNLSVNLALIPFFGFYGAAVATLISFLAYLVMIRRLYRTTVTALKAPRESMISRAVP